MKFYYTDGSSTFNAVSGFGCVNSKQTETFSINSPSTLNSQPSTFEVFTFPHEANDFLDITITALDNTGSTLAEKKLENLYIQPKVITQHTCRFFNDSIPFSTSFTLENEGPWSDLWEQ